MLLKLLIYILIKSIICDDIELEDEIELMMDTYSPYLTSGELLRSQNMSIEDFGKLEKKDLSSDPESQMKYIEGDMMLDKKDFKQVLFVAKKWPKGRIPYILETHFTPLERHAISRGIITIQKKTCVQFAPKQWFDKDFVHIMKGRGCGAHVGRRGGRQLIHLGRGCFNLDTIIHELMHSIGFIHEQSRPDRDLYVDIHWKNIIRGREPNFRKHSRDYFAENGFPYDLLSVMHYREYSFSKNGLKTITSKEPIPHLRCRPRDCPTDLDVKKINQFYECFIKNSDNSNSNSITNSHNNDYSNQIKSNQITSDRNDSKLDVNNNTIKLSETQIEINAIEEVLSTLIPNF